MVKRKKTQARRKTRRPESSYCPFCKEGTSPSYRDSETLRHFITDRAKIVPRARSGVCAKHQRRLTREIKRARHLALLPFLVKPTE